MRAVISRPSGAVVLPALDLSLEDESWNKIAGHPEHPQFGLKKLLDELGLSRGEVRELPRLEIAASRRARAAFFSEAMRPAATTNLWHGFAMRSNRRCPRGWKSPSLTTARS